MEKIIQIILLVLVITPSFAQTSLSAVNAIIGDLSFVERFGQMPRKDVDEKLRIETHLNYMEAVLLQKSYAHLTQAQKEKRAMVISLLHSYWIKGVFPKNLMYTNRRPCFIDEEGNICAVGYLIEKTKGRELVQQINKSHQYELLQDMNEECIAAWANEYGLTLEECAMIQPTYGPIPTDETYSVPIKTVYGTASGILGGVNAGIIISNFSKSNISGSNTVSYLGLVSGTAQIILGLTNIRKDQKEFSINAPSRTLSYQSQNTLSYINLAAGTATLLTNTANLLLKRAVKDTRCVLHFYNYTETNNKLVTGIALTRSL